MDVDLLDADDLDEAYLALLVEVEAEGAEVARHPMGAMGYEDLIQVISDSERTSRAAIARGMRAAAELSRRLPTGGWGTAKQARDAGVSEYAVTHLALAMGVSTRSADIRLNEALTLDDRLPRTMAALTAGILGMPAVRVLVAETMLLEAAGTAEVESRVLDHLGATTIPGLGRLTPTQITALRLDQAEHVAGSATSALVRRITRRAVTQVDADAVRERAKAAPLTRTVELSPSYAGDGMAWLGSFLPEGHAWAAYSRVCAIADRATGPDDPRTIDQVRADVFLDLLLGAHLPQPASDHPHDPDDPDHDDPGPGDPHPTSPGGSGPRVPWSGPVGVPINLTVIIDAQGVAEAPGYGPIQPDTLHQLTHLAARTSGTVKTIVANPVTCPGTHPDITTTGTTTDPHAPPPPMRRAVQLRNPTCVFPGCAHTATRCDLDHTTPWPHGPTCPCNLGPLCRRHHRLKTHDPGWHLTNHNNGTFTWTTPWRTSYTVTP